MRSTKQYAIYKNFVTNQIYLRLVETVVLTGYINFCANNNKKMEIFLKFFNLENVQLTNK